MKPPGAVRLLPVPVTLREALEYLKSHRHHRPPRGGKFAIGAMRETPPGLCGVVVVGRPLARALQDGWTAEVVRLATDGTPNACSMLYRAAWRASRAMGYTRLVTYNLKTEPGTSLRAAGFKVVGEVRGRSWDCPSRPRVDLYPHQGKLRWELTA